MKQTNLWPGKEMCGGHIVSKDNVQIKGTKIFGSETDGSFLSVYTSWTNVKDKIDAS